jgi:ankyrin repeat protein
LERLLRKGLPPDARSATGDTPLIAAAARGDTQIVHVLLDGGASIDAQNAVGNTALIEGVRAGQTEVCRMLLAAGADAGLHDHDRIAALDTARRRHFSDIVVMLESH